MRGSLDRDRWRLRLTGRSTSATTTRPLCAGSASRLRGEATMTGKLRLWTVVGAALIAMLAPAGCGSDDRGEATSARDASAVGAAVDGGSLFVVPSGPGDLSVADGRVELS